MKRYKLNSGIFVKFECHCDCQAPATQMLNVKTPAQTQSPPIDDFLASILNTQLQ